MATTLSFEWLNADELNYSDARSQRTMLINWQVDFARKHDSILSKVNSRIFGLLPHSDIRLQFDSWIFFPTRFSESFTIQCPARLRFCLHIHLRIPRQMPAISQYSYNSYNTLGQSPTLHCSGRWRADRQIKFQYIVYSCSSNTTYARFTVSYWWLYFSLKWSLRNI